MEKVKALIEHLEKINTDIFHGNRDVGDTVPERVINEIKKKFLGDNNESN